MILTAITKIQDCAKARGHVTWRGRRDPQFPNVFENALKTRHVSFSGFLKFIVLSVLFCILCSALYAVCLQPTINGAPAQLCLLLRLGPQSSHTRHMTQDRKRTVRVIKKSNGKKLQNYSLNVFLEISALILKYLLTIQHVCDIFRILSSAGAPSHSWISERALETWTLQCH